MDQRTTAYTLQPQHYWANQSRFWKLRIPLVEDYHQQLKPSKITYMMGPLQMYRPRRPSLWFHRSSNAVISRTFLHEKYELGKMSVSFCIYEPGHPLKHRAKSIVVVMVVQLVVIGAPAEIGGVGPEATTISILREAF
ncbi:hypothetical protein E3N88_03137 [Mikania micrantha]|uniref:Uncharacterized protein n=1 Tax=Mikania micrantha TaxID=192012 RepID=A0A5N6Q814_9ASTR|nr:hypothetical protein E3N88_03137 [Mikania micrantha]